MSVRKQTESYSSRPYPEAMLGCCEFNLQGDLIQGGIEWNPFLVTRSLWGFNSYPQRFIRLSRVVWHNHNICSWPVVGHIYHTQIIACFRAFSRICDKELNRQPKDSYKHITCFSILLGREIIKGEHRMCASVVGSGSLLLEDKLLQLGKKV